MGATELAQELGPELGLRARVRASSESESERDARGRGAGGARGHGRRERSDGGGGGGGGSVGVRGGRTGVRGRTRERNRRQRSPGNAQAWECGQQRCEWECEWVPRRVCGERRTVGRERRERTDQRRSVRRREAYKITSVTPRSDTTKETATREL